MGQMRFVAPERRNLAADAADRAYFTGLDEIPWRSRTTWSGDTLVIRRSEDDSGNFHIPYHVAGHGELSLSTACLMERDAPYLLPVELARGAVHRVRTQIATWQSVGVQLPVPKLLPEALEWLSKAATSQEDPAKAADYSDRALRTALDCMQELGRLYVENSLAARRRQTNRPAPAFGVNLGRTIISEPVQRFVVSSCNTGVVPFTWSDVEQHEGRRDWSLADRQVEWCRANSLKTLSGPLLDLEPSNLPGWLFLYEGNVTALHDAFTNHLRAVVERYRGKIHLWQASAKFNAGDALELDEEHRLRFVATALDTIRSIDPKTPMTIVIDQPWGEFMREQDCDFSPLHFADALVRSDLGISGIGLEINLGYSTAGTQPRDLFDFIRLVDRWSSLGLPLLITLTAPSATTPDAKAQAKVQPLHFGGDLAGDAAQAALIEKLVPALLAKPAVQSVVWNQLLDAAPHAFANAGLFDGANQPKPAANAFREVRQRCLP